MIFIFPIATDCYKIAFPVRSLVIMNIISLGRLSPPIVGDYEHDLSPNTEGDYEISGEIRG